MDTCASYYWPNETSSFDVKLIDVLSEHTGRAPTDLPAIGDDIDVDAITAIVQAGTRTRLAFDVEIPGLAMGTDGEPVRTVTVKLETGPDDPVHITVTDQTPDSTGVGATPRIW